MDENFSQSIVVVGDAPTCTGFRLAGVSSVHIADEGNAGEIIDGLISSSDSGIIIVNERLLERLDSKMRKKIERLAKPVIIAVPDKDGATEQADSLKNMVKKALGFELIK